MPISFNQIPGALRVPIVSAEFDASRASQGPSLLAYRGLILGQKIAAGSAAANSLHRVFSAAEVIPLTGRGSMMHREAIAWFDANQSTELWIGVLDDDGAAVAASGTITVTGTATASGVIALYLGGERVVVSVTSADDADAVAASIVAAINDNLDLPVTAVDSGSGVVTITQRNGGEVGNSYDMRDSYRFGEAVPSGVSLVYVAMSGGASNPSLASLIAALGDGWYQVIAHPYTDATSLSAIETELADRFGPIRMINGVAVTSAVGTLGQLTTLGSGRNSPHSVILAQPGQNPLTPPVEFAAEAAGLIAFYGASDPARPFQTLPMRRSLPPDEVDRFTLLERNQLLFDGIGTASVGPGDLVQLGRVITTYQQNSAGAEDDAYLDATTMLTLLYLRYSFRVRMQTRYPRHKLADDSTSVAPGQPVMTPRIGRAESVGWFREMQDLLLVEGLDQFKQDLVVERNVSDPNRLDFLLPPDLINQLIVSAAQIQFRL